MSYPIKKHPVHHPLLRNYIKFYWEIHANALQLAHKIIPVRNIDLKFNLGETPHYLHLNGDRHRLETVYFSGLQEQYRNARLELSGNAHVMGICFQPDACIRF